MSKIANGQNEYYSEGKPTGEVNLFLDENGMPTMEYPHVHVNHNADGVTVTVSCSEGKNDNFGHQHLSGENIGQEVASAVQSAIKFLFG